MSTSTNMREVTQLAGEDRRAARILVGAEADARRAEQERAAADAAAERELRVASGRVDIDAKRRAARRTEQGEIEAQRRAQRAAARSERQARAAARRAWIGARIDYARDNAAAVYSSVIYGLAVGGAVYGQLTAAAARGWPLLIGVTVAAALEGTALAMALTAQQQRLAGERALTARVLTWAGAGAAAAINFFGHIDTDPTGAVVLAALSLLGIVVWEVRSGRKHRKALRALGMIPDPPAQFGWRRWARYPRSTFAAWSADVRDRVSPRTAVLFATVAAERRGRQVARMARAELAAARKRGDGPAVVAALVRLAAGDGAPDGAAAGPGTDPDIAQVTASASRTRVRAYVGTGVPAHVGTYPGTDAGADGDAYAGADLGTDAGAYLPAGVGADVPAYRPARVAAAARTPRRGGVRASARTDVLPDVAALLPAGAAVRARLAAAGRALTRDALVTGLREDGHAVSNRRASALLAALNTDVPPATQPA